MHTIVVWLLISLQGSVYTGKGYAPSLIATFPTKEDCSFVVENMRKYGGSQPLMCIQANIVAGTK